MRRNMGFTIQIERRIYRLKKTVKVDTQDLRTKWIAELDNLFDMATSIANGKVNQQQFGDKLQFITPKERQMWAQVSANIGMVMSNLAKGYDETKFNEDLAKLEKLTNEITTFTDEIAEKQALPEPSLTSPNDSTGK
jgi:hypothetical protein